jgi:hypothetical protein
MAHRIVFGTNAIIIISPSIRYIKLIISIPGIEGLISIILSRIRLLMSFIIL